MKLSSDTSDFLATLLFVAADGPHQGHNHRANWTIHQFHPEFTAAVDSFLSGFRDYLDDALPDVDPDDCQRSFGGNVFLSLSGHGAGFWDGPRETDDQLQAALEIYSGDKYRFEHMTACALAKFSGKIHLSYRTAAFRREYLAKLFTPAVNVAPVSA